MAEAILSEIAVSLVSKVGDLLLNEIVLWWGVKDELDQLKNTVDTIEAVILDAEEQSINNHEVKQWLGKLSEVMYEAEDLLDEFSTEALRQQVTGVSKVRLFFSSSNQLAFGLKLARKIKALRKRFDRIAAYPLQNPCADELPASSNWNYQGYSLPPEVVVGREQEKEAIVQVLLSPDYEENVSVVAIVGFEGLGKTTLAQLVYNDQRVQRHFELRIWMCVSDHFDVGLMVENVVNSASRQATETTQIDVLKNRVSKNIKERRYLLVLDNVWDEDVRKWSSLKDLLAWGAQGSKILITTGSRTVAQISRPVYKQRLRGLSEDEAWLLFKQFAFRQGKQLNPSLEAMGKEIVEKCCGVPLAIRAMGAMLSFKDPQEWLCFKNNDLWKIDVFNNDILPILRLSYNRLPSHYKHCFAYCSLYPKNYKIPVDKLIQQWRAQGYIKLRNLDECLSDVGFEYFMDLFQMSFFQDAETDEFGKVEYCKMHSLMHDLAVSVAVKNFSASHFGMTRIENYAKHISFQGCSNYLSLYTSSVLEAKATRTILALDKDMLYSLPEKKKLHAIFSSLKRLRVLGLSHMGISTLPDSIYKLKHLRYLDLSHNDDINRTCCMKLPNSITKLQNLEVLKLTGCPNLLQLPSKISKLVNLTDLDNYNCSGLSHMPRGIGKLTRLEKLPEYVIAKDHSISKHIGGLDELHSLNNLRGELHIKNLRYVKASEFTKACMNKKKKLQKLKLHWGLQEDESNNYSENVAANEETGMEALRPHQNLKQLTVLYYRGVKPPRWLPSITSLVSISLLFCRSIQWLPPLNQLPHLKMLYISGLTKLESIYVEYGGEGSSSFFLSLTDLTLAACPNLKGFERQSSSSTQEPTFFPRVPRSEISGAPNPTLLALPEQKKQESDGDGVKSLVVIPKKDTNLASQSTSSTYSPLSQSEPSLSTEELPFFPSLSQLEISGCPCLTLMPLFPELKRLDLDGDGTESLKRILEESASSASESTSAAYSPLSQLEHLSISNTSGSQENELQYSKSLQWLPSFTNLVSLSLLFCGIDWLPPFEQLPRLRKLNISSLTKLESIDVENGREGSPSFFPCLTDLTLKNCSSLKGFQRLSQLSLEELPCFPCLSHLQINSCPKLTYLPLSPELKTLKLDGDGMKSLLKVMKKQKNSASQSTSSSFTTLSHLQHLEISNMNDHVEDELLQYLSSLQSVTFFQCSFRTVCSTEKDDGMPWQSLKVLRSVVFRYMENLVTLPMGLQYVTTLQHLSMHDCHRLVCIPEWMSKLTALKDLAISASPQIKRRCENGSAVDWPKISHIPNIEIDLKQIQRNGSYLP